MIKLFAVLWLAAACGSADKQKDETKEAAKKPEDVEFSGFVQKAFTVRVNGVEFADSEQFYTRFIDELVKPTYPELSAKSVTLEGKYGLDEFGSNSKVFVSSMATDGHLYEGRTDAQSKFVVKVQAAALDESFKARVVVRIGLEIDKGGTDDLRYCYILHGTREGVLVSESSKPIIFDDFKTQLTTYKCEDVKEDAISIPGVGGGAESPAEPKALPAVSFGQARRVQLGNVLPAQLDGGSQLSAASVDEHGNLLAALSPARDKASGKWVYPVVKLASVGAGTAVLLQLGESDSDLSLFAGIESVVAKGDALIATLGDKWASLKDDGTGWAESPWDRQSHMAVVVDGAVKAISGRETCDLEGGCEQAPSNPCDLGFPRTYAYYAGAILAANGVNSQGSGYCGGMAIHALSPKLSYLRKYAVSQLDVDSETFRASKLATYNNKLYLVSLKDRELQVRELTLKE